MMGLLARLFGGPTPTISEARPSDAAAIAALHKASFQRGWGEDEVYRLLVKANVLAHRTMSARTMVGFILSRLATGEAEILSVAIAPARRGRGYARPLLDLHLRRLAGLGVRTVFLEVGEGNAAANRLYHRAGFREVGRREGYYPDRMDKGHVGDFPGQARGTAALVLRCDFP